MKRNPVNRGIVANGMDGVGEISRQTVEKRARQLAELEGRSVASEADLARAKRELTGGSDLDRRQEALESLPESDRWNPVPGSPGREHLELPNEDEDDEGRNESAQLVEEGVQEAEHDQMIEAEESAESAEDRDEKKD